MTVNYELSWILVEVVQAYFKVL